MTTNSRPFRKRKAMHGTQHLYRFHYTDDGDTGCPTFTWRCWAYNREDAEERFFGDGDEGWIVEKVERVRETPAPRLFIN